MDSFNKISKDKLKSAGPEEAVTYFRALLLAEAARCNIPSSKVTVSDEINRPDGGIDASVEKIEVEFDEDLIKNGFNAYQIKSGDSFNPTHESNVRKELFRKDDKENLKEGIRDCLDKDGTYTIVTFGHDLLPLERTKSRQLFGKSLRGCGYKNPKIDVIGSDQLSILINKYPALALKLAGKSGMPCFFHDEWANHEDMRQPRYIEESEHKQKIKDIQKVLQFNQPEGFIRIKGEAGIGKTRFVFEATKSEELKSLVLYFKSGEKFDNSAIEYELMREKKMAIIVVDECSRECMHNISNSFHHCINRLKFITITNEEEVTIENVVYFDVPLLSTDSISKIIQSYHVPKNISDRYAVECGGSPRVALIAGRHLSEYPDDPFKSLFKHEFWNTYIAGEVGVDSEMFMKRKAILQHFALFTKFGFEAPYNKEKEAIYDFIVRNDSTISKQIFEEHVKYFRRRKILQGATTLYITPHLLHLKSFKDWWDIYGSNFDLFSFLEDIPPKLKEWFSEMFQYAARSDISRKYIEDLLSETGLLGKYGYNVINLELGSGVFLSIAKADPKNALIFLKRALDNKSKNELLEFTIGRRNVIWALDFIAVWKDLFTDAARILLQIAEAENETWGNNATGVFTGFFSSGVGELAPTEATPAQRFPVIKEAFESDSTIRKKIALEACDQALESKHWARFCGLSDNIMFKKPNRYSPKTGEEYYDNYRRIWKFLEDMYPLLEKELKDKTIGIMLDRSAALLRMEDISPMILSTLKRFSSDSYSDKTSILKMVINALTTAFGEEYSQETYKELIRIREEIGEKDFSAKLRRYVGLNIYEEYKERVDKDGQYRQYLKNKEQNVEKLAEESLDNKKVLHNELPWLVTKKAENGFQFAYFLGLKDTQYIFLEEIMSAQRKAGETGTPDFLGGYFNAIYKKDENKWEKLIERFTRDNFFVKIVPNLILNSKINDKNVVRLLNLAEKNLMEIYHFNAVYYGTSIQDISKNIFNKIIRYLLDHEDPESILIALGLYSRFYISKESKYKIPKVITFELLINKKLFKKLEDVPSSQRDGYSWRKIANEYIKKYPEESIKFAHILIENFGESNTMFSYFDRGCEKILVSITKRHPFEVLSFITKFLKPPYTIRRYHIKELLRGSMRREEREGIIAQIPQEMLWSWVEEDKASNTIHIAMFLPPTLESEITREFLKKYGDEQKVRGKLIINFSNESWTGPASQHFTERKDELEKLKEKENHPNIIAWIDDYIEELDNWIENARKKEERDDY